MPLRAVIFDLDDTLLDSSALRDARAAHDWRAVVARLDEVRQFEVADGEPQVANLPRLARDRDLAVGVLTHSPRAYAAELLRRYGIVTDGIVTGSDGYPRKPDPTGLKALIADFNVNAADTLMVGDDVVDFEAAAAVGVRSAGVSWAHKPVPAWAHSWPDAAVATSKRLLELLDGDECLGPWAEVIAAGGDPHSHWGSLVRLGDGTFGLGRYFPLSDTRYPEHSLSHLVLRAKDDKEAAEEVATIFESLAEKLTTGPPAELVVSVPPEPDGYDRFALARAAIANVWDARDGEELLTMSYTVEGYKHLAREDRAGHNVNRFECSPLGGERVLLIDDVLTSGGQSDACRAALEAAGSGPVTVLVLSVTQDKLTEPCPLCGANSGRLPATVMVRSSSAAALGG